MGNLSSFIYSNLIICPQPMDLTLCVSLGCFLLMCRSLLLQALFKSTLTVLLVSHLTLKTFTFVHISIDSCVCVCSGSGHLVGPLTHHSCTRSLLSLLFSEDISFSSLFPLHCFFHILKCDEALQQMNYVSSGRGSLPLSCFASSLVKAKRSTKMLSFHLRRMDRKKKEEGNTKRMRGNILEQFNSIICFLQEVALSHISIMSLFWLAALGLVQTLVAEDVGWQEFSHTLELHPSKWVNCEFLQRCC